MEALANIGFDWQVALSNFVTFLIILWVLSRFVFKPIGKIIEERKKKIQEGLENAQQSENELLLAQEKAEEEIKAAKSQANQIIADAKGLADAQIENAQERAQQEASSILEKADVQISKNQEKMEKELADKTAGLIALGVQKILGEEVTESKNNELSKKALDIFNNQK